MRPLKMQTIGQRNVDSVDGGVVEYSWAGFSKWVAHVCVGPRKKKKKRVTIVAVDHVGNAVLFGVSGGLLLVARSDGVDDDLRVALGWIDERLWPAMNAAVSNVLITRGFGPTYAILAAPKMPNLSAPSCFAMVGGLKIK